MRRLLPLFLAALAAAAPEPPAPAPAMGDAEAAQYLRGGELAEWSRARNLLDIGKARAAQGKSISETPRVPIKGAGGESPEAARQRGLAIQREGEEQVARAQLTLTRLRAVAAARYAEQTKTVSAASEIGSQSWKEGVLLAAVRGVKAARDTGAERHHVLGVWSFDAAGRPAPQPELADGLRAAWRTAQAEREYLQPAPAGGYRLRAGAEAARPTSLAADDPGPAAPGEIALAWAEVHALGDDVVLVLVRVADAHSLRLVFSESFLASPKGDRVPLAASLTLRDDRSFLPRLGASASWRLGFAPGAPPLAASALRHVCKRLGQVEVWADDELVALGVAELPARANALWTIKPVAAAASGERAWDLSSTPTTAGAKPVAVGRLTLRVASTAPAPAPR